jgi:hypothetical protein
MIALDLDGSLLRSDKTVGERTIKALQAAAAKGVEIVLASGRMTAAMEKPATIIGIDVSMVAFNGAAVCGRAATKRERYFHQPLDAGIASELLDIAHQRGYQCNFYQNDVILSEDGPNLRPYIEIYRGRTGSPFRFVKNLRDFAASAPTKLLYVVDAGKRNAISEELRPRFGSRTAMMHTDPEYLEFLDPQVNKGTGLNKLGEVLGIPMTQAMAIGDGENDIPMLEVAGIGVAVANAGKLCKAAANAFTDADNDHDAVAEALEKWVL